MSHLRDEFGREKGTKKWRGRRRKRTERGLRQQQHNADPELRRGIHGGAKKDHQQGLLDLNFKDQTY